jgi:hypothetical protein
MDKLNGNLININTKNDGVIPWLTIDNFTLELIILYLEDEILAGLRKLIIH